MKKNFYLFLIVICFGLNGCFLTDKRYLKHDDSNLLAPFENSTVIINGKNIIELYKKSPAKKVYESDQFEEVLIASYDQAGSGNSIWLIQAKIRNTENFQYFFLWGYYKSGKMSYTIHNQDVMERRLLSWLRRKDRSTYDQIYNSDWKPESVFEILCGSSRSPDGSLDTSCFHRFSQTRVGAKDKDVLFWDMDNPSEAKEARERIAAVKNYGGAYLDANSKRIMELKEIMVPVLDASCNTARSIGNQMTRGLARWRREYDPQLQEEVCTVTAFTGFEASYWIDFFDTSACENGICTVSYDYRCVYKGAAAKEVCQRITEDGYEASIFFENGSPVKLIK